MYSKRWVLIETYWNVNKKFLSKLKKGENVLIETYWNVNFTTSIDRKIADNCINRNILECK